MFGVSTNYSTSGTPTLTAVIQLGVASLTAQNSVLSVDNHLTSGNLNIEILFDVEITLQFTEGSPAPAIVAVAAGSNTIAITNIALTAEVQADGILAIILTDLSEAYAPLFEQQLAQTFHTKNVATLLSEAISVAFLPGQVGTGGLGLLAYGGRGGRGQDGSAGQTGTPGTPGVNIPESQQTFSYPTSPPPSQCDGGPGGQGGAGGNAGSSGAGGAGGAIIVLTGTQIEGVGLTAVAGGGIGGVPALLGPGGAGGLGGAPGTYVQVEQIADFRDYINGEGSAGTQGPAGPNGQAGAWGANGAATPISINGQSSLSGQWPVGGNYDGIGAYLPLCQMTLEQEGAKLAYLNAAASQQSDGTYADVVTFYNWIFRTTQQYLANATTQNQIALQQICVSAQIALSRLAAGLDYFGDTSNWAPVLDYQFYGNRVSELITLCGTIQSSYTSALNASNSGQAAAAQNAITTLQADLQNYSNLEQSVSSQIAAIDSTVVTLSTQISDQIAAVQQAFNTAQIQFTETLFSNACPFSEIVTVVKSLAQIATAAASAEEDLVGSIESIAENSATIFDNIQNTINQIQTAEAEWSALQQAWGQIQIDVNSGNNALIISDETGFDSLINTYFSDLPDAETVEDDVNTLLNLAQARNQALMTATNLQAQLIALQTQYKQTAAQMEYLAGISAAGYAPQLPEYLSFLQSALYTALNDLLNNLYFMNQAYCYWGVISSPIVFESLDVGTLSATYNDILDDIEEWLEKTGRPFAAFQGIEVPITVADNAAAFALLQQTQQLSVQIEIDSNGPFQELYNVTAETVAVSLQGITPPSGAQLFVNLIQNGPDQCQDQSGNIVTFSHTPRPVPFEYSYAQNEILVTGTIGDTSQGFNGLSPFANWILDFSAPMNSWLFANNNELLKQVTGLTLTFSGYALGPASVDTLKKTDAVKA